MGKLYNFRRIIAKYSVSFTLIIHDGGGYVGGKWVDGEAIKIEKRGAIVPVSASGSANSNADAQAQHPGGSYITGVRRLYMADPIKEALNGARVEYKGQGYHIKEDTDFGDYADAYIYTIRRVDLFDKY